MASTLKAEKKQQVLRQSKYICHYCRGKADTVDHKISVFMGGSNEFSNLVACCGDCNQAKGHLIPYALFKRWIRRKGVTVKKAQVRATNLYRINAIEGMWREGMRGARLIKIVRKRYPDDGAKLIMRFLNKKRSETA